MTKDDIIFALDQLKKEEVVITDQMNVFKDLGMDSLGFIEFIAKMENMVGVEFIDLDKCYDNINNVGDLCSYIMGKVERDNE